MMRDVLWIVCFIMFGVAGFFVSNILREHYPRVHKGVTLFLLVGVVGWIISQYR